MASSALEALKALANKKTTTVAPSLSAEMNDPAITGARRDKNTVKLGFDPAITEHAALAAELKMALDKAEAEFKVEQAVLRDYGKQKRSLYNNVFKTNVTTVCVPFTTEVPHDDASDTPGRETQYAQVICTNKYSVEQETVLALEGEIGPDLFPKLFVKEETKVLKPNAETLVRGLLAELGVEGEALENSMNALFDTSVKVKAVEGYEQEIKKAPEAVQTVLSQSVTRVQPGLKFPS